MHSNSNIPRIRISRKVSRFPNVFVSEYERNTLFEYIRNIRKLSVIETIRIEKFRSLRELTYTTRSQVSLIPLCHKLLQRRINGVFRGKWSLNHRAQVDLAAWHMSHVKWLAVPNYITSTVVQEIHMNSILVFCNGALYMLVDTPIVSEPRSMLLLDSIMVWRWRCGRYPSCPLHNLTLQYVDRITTPSCHWVH